jgi:tyrosyl-tRNA synthetase
MPQQHHDFVDELQYRGLFHQCTDERGLRAHLAAARAAGAAHTRRAYIGFDPTADSLTIGNLVQILILGHWQRAGHQPVVVMGGGTGLIGDPSGKSAERTLRTREEVEHNVTMQRRIFERILDLAPPLSSDAGAPSGYHAVPLQGEDGNKAIVVNNADWLCRMSYLDMLRDVGKHFSVNQMIQKESVSARLNNREQGISYTEFSYMILQAYDFLHLHQHLGVSVQCGGSDQFGNIVSGLDLIRRHAAREHGGEQAESHAFGVTTPLVTKADGTKFGKTESGAVWCTADRTSPYAFYQFWLNTSDADIPRFLKTFGFLPHEEIERLLASHAQNPGMREAHKALARHMTDLLHGEREREAAEAAAGALFSGDVASLPLATLKEVLASAPNSQHAKALLAGEGVPLLDLLAQTSLAKSKSEARRHLEEKSVSINGQPATLETRLTTASLLHGTIIALRRGKKNWHVTTWE